jgi:hypothetical protein
MTKIIPCNEVTNMYWFYGKMFLGSFKIVAQKNILNHEKTTTKICIVVLFYGRKTNNMKGKISILHTQHNIYFNSFRPTIYKI